VSKDDRFIRNLPLLLDTCLHDFFLLNFFHKVGRVRVDGIATRYWLGESGDRTPVRTRFSAPVQTGPGPTKTSFCTMGTVSLPLGKAAGDYR